MYLVDDALHDSLVTRSPSFTFELGNSKIGGSTVKITLPYDSFDLSFLPDVDAAPLRYFPIQRAANDSQLTLGRTFLQEAYLITDYQHRNFSVSQCVFDEPIEQKIVPILSENTTMTADTVPTSSSINVAHKAAHLELQKIVGISVGAAIGFLVLLTLSCWPFIARHQRRFGSKARASGSFPYAIQHEFHVDHKSTQSSPDSSTPHLRSQSGINATSHKNVAEIGTNSWNFLREVADNGKIELPENPNLYELSQENRTATSEARTSRTRIPQTRLNPGRRRGLIVSNDDHRLTLGGLRLSRTEPAPSTERSDADLSLRSYLSSKSLPATPISESPQESAFPTWVRVAKHQHEGKGSDAPPLRFPENPFQHRRGFF
ncbi:MAG: hypothetical protein L6R41_001736 [Letrouitia leprolyta]|nr:MAG: hypothetical protein L6R41_001736 [Letrouitia leprolyta]